MVPSFTNFIRVVDDRDHRDALEDVWRRGQCVGEVNAEVEGFDYCWEIYSRVSHVMTGGRRRNMSTTDRYALAYLVFAQPM